MVELTIKKDGELLDELKGDCVAGFSLARSENSDAFDITAFLSGNCTTVEGAQAAAGIVGNILNNCKDRALFLFVFMAELQTYMQKDTNGEEVAE